YNGKYYLQYSGPGTEFKSYSDAVYVSEKPLGPFTAQVHNPMSYKPEGFAAGAGHGSTFADGYGNYWHIGTMTISQKHMFERRLGLFPTFVDHHGTLYTSTKYGDYPMIIPDKKIASADELFPGWMLLSYGKSVMVSSAVDSFPASNMTDENIRTYWSAQTGNTGEHAILDLGGTADVYAVQINFAEHNTTILGRQKDLFHRYKVEYSDDGANWQLLLDKSRNETDNTHVYEQLKDKISCRYLKITNVQVPGGNFAISDLRIFGKGSGKAPAKVQQFKAQRNPNDKREVTLTWEKADGATGYNISYGTDKDHLYQNYMVYGATQLTINSLNAAQAYFYTIESFNENGITEGGEVTGD
ncbi:MAG TPA: discoidin domain-containing protein, partial [Ohtaekwangia sp.]